MNAAESDERRPCPGADVGVSADGGLGTAELPLFPLLPGGFAEWGETLQRWPALEPQLHRLDEGLAFRLDRSAVAGNGVVPLAAARV